MSLGRALLLAAGAFVATLLVLSLGYRMLAPDPEPTTLAATGSEPKSDEGPPARGFEVALPRQRVEGLSQPTLADALEHLGKAVEAKAAAFDDPEVAEAIRAGTRPRKDAHRGPTGAGGNWEIRFVRGSTAESYARQLDFFKIELGAVMPDNQLVCVSAFTESKPKVRTRPANEERRYYFTWRGGEMEQADLDLLARAGVNAKGRVVLKLLPPSLQEKLAALEREHAGDKAERIRKTRFAVRPQQSAYEFHVLEQWYQ